MTEKLRIVFMGTPEFAVESLKALLENDRNIAAVITAPDKPSGRGKQIMPPPVKQYALSAGIENILQPENLKDPDFLTELKKINADLYVVVAFRMLPEAVWSIPPKGTINLHASLLPDYRGAAPINWVLINGEPETGITTFFIDKNIDTGKIILQDRVNISPTMNAGELHDLLMTKGAQLLTKTVHAISENNYPVVAQSMLMDGKTLHTARKIFKEDCKINWNNTVLEIYNFIRGLSPYPAAWTEIVSESILHSVKIFSCKKHVQHHSSPNGTLITDGSNYLNVAAKDGFIDIGILQLAGKKPMEIKEFLRGFKDIENFKALSD